MRNIYTKANRQYKKIYQTVTSICEENGKKLVIKKAAVPEAKGHIENMYKNSKVTFPNMTMCPCTLKDGELIFDFIEGEMLSKRLMDAVNNNDKTAFYKTIDLLFDIMKVDESEFCEFDNSDSFKAVFGDAPELMGKRALKYCVFDCTANNIILKDKAYFIDYEWGFDFPVLYDLWKLHAIYSMYYIDPKIEEFEPFKNVFEHMGSDCDMQTLIDLRANFCDHISGGYYTGGYLKRAIKLGDVVNDNEFVYEREITGLKNYISILENAREQSDEYVKALEDSAKQMEAYVKELENASLKKDEYVKELENASRQKDEYIASLERNIKYNEDKIAELGKEVEELIEKNNQLHRELFYIQNSLSWKITKPLRSFKR